ncbi:MAG TPA: hypothetical protein PLH29_02100 [bacterium]|mgnify:CR=1 FL=1|nr:hypothetical protein [bacterium]
MSRGFLSPCQERGSWVTSRNRAMQIFGRDNVLGIETAIRLLRTSPSQPERSFLNYINLSEEQLKECAEHCNLVAFLPKSICEMQIESTPGAFDNYAFDHYCRGRNFALDRGQIAWWLLGKAPVTKDNLPIFKRLCSVLRTDQGRAPANVLSYAAVGDFLPKKMCFNSADFCRNNPIYVGSVCNRILVSSWYGDACYEIGEIFAHKVI